MTLPTLRRVIETYLELPFPGGHSIAFQGGEPLLMGEDFFREAENIAKGRISFSVQTNATLVTPSLAAFFAEHDWLVGVSPHHPAAADFQSSYELLRSAGVATNVLYLVTKANCSDPVAAYHYIRDELGCAFHQYIECTSPRDFALSADEWARFMIAIFDEWLECGDEHRVSVRLFDSIMSELATTRPTQCNFAQDCRHYLVVDCNGDVYPCDFFVEEGWKLGSMLEQDWLAIANSRKYAAFGLAKRDHADCPRNAHSLDSAWSEIYAHCVPRLREIMGR